MAATAQAAPLITESLISSYETRNVVILGSLGCGKTSLSTMIRLASNTFNDMHCETLGADKFIKHITTVTKKSTLSIWCCGGHPRLKPILDQFYENINAAILVFDMLNLNSFRDLPFWYNEIKRVSPNAQLYLVGTKMDDADNIAIDVNEAAKQADAWNAISRNVSSKTGVGVLELFQEIAENLSAQ